MKKLNDLFKSLCFHYIFYGECKYGDCCKKEHPANSEIIRDMIKDIFKYCEKYPFELITPKEKYEKFFSKKDFSDEEKDKSVIKNEVIKLLKKFYKKLKMEYTPKTIGLCRSHVFNGCCKYKQMEIEINGKTHCMCYDVGKDYVKFINVCGCDVYTDDKITTVKNIKYPTKEEAILGSMFSPRRVSHYTPPRELRLEPIEQKEYKASDFPKEFGTTVLPTTSREYRRKLNTEKFNIKVEELESESLKERQLELIHEDMSGRCSPAMNIPMAASLPEEELPMAYNDLRLNYISLKHTFHSMKDRYDGELLSKIDKYQFKLTIFKRIIEYIDETNLPKVMEELGIYLSDTDSNEDSESDDECMPSIDTPLEGK